MKKAEGLCFLRVIQTITHLLRTVIGHCIVARLLLAQPCTDKELAHLSPGHRIDLKLGDSKVEFNRAVEDSVTFQRLSSDHSWDENARLIFRNDETVTKRPVPSLLVSESQPNAEL